MHLFHYNSHGRVCNQVVDQDYFPCTASRSQAHPEAITDNSRCCWRTAAQGNPPPPPPILRPKRLPGHEHVDLVSFWLRAQIQQVRLRQIYPYKVPSRDLIL